MISDERREFLLKVLYFTTITGASILFGFSTSVKKFNKESPANREAALHCEGVALARKALLRGTIYSVCGFGVFTTATYLLVGKKLISQFKKQHENSEPDKDLVELQSLFK